MSPAQRQSSLLRERVETPLSVGSLAARLGVPRQRIYTLVQRGQIRAVSMSGGLVISPDEANRVLEAAIRIDTPKGRNRLVFDFV
jgi:excisionase family DNA binding protein